MAKLGLPGTNTGKKSDKDKPQGKTKKQLYVEQRVNQIADTFNSKSANYRYKNKSAYQTLRDNGEISSIPRTYELDGGIRDYTAYKKDRDARIAKTGPEHQTPTYNMNRSTDEEKQALADAVSAYASRRAPRQQQGAHSRNERSSYYNPSWQSEIDDHVLRLTDEDYAKAEERLNADKEARLRAQSDKFSDYNKYFTASNFNDGVEKGKQIAIANGDVPQTDYEKSALDKKNKYYYSLSTSTAENISAMTDDERNLYYYLLGTKGEAAAEEFEDLMQETLNYRLGEIKAGNAYDIVTPFVSNLQGAFSSAGNAVLGAVDATGLGKVGSVAAGNKLSDYESGKTISTSAGQYADQLFRSDMTGARKVVNDLTATLANQVPSIALTYLTGGIGGSAQLARLAGSLFMGASAAGSTYKNSIDEGYSVDQSALYGGLNGLSEVALESLLGGVMNGASRLATKATGINVGTLSNTLARVYGKILKNHPAIATALGNYTADALGEFVEEATQDAIDPVIKGIATGERGELKLDEETLYSGILGALSAGVMNAPALGVDIHNGRIKSTPADLGTISAAKGINSTDIPMAARGLNNIAAAAARATENTTPTTPAEAARRAAENAVNPAEEAVAPKVEDNTAPAVETAEESNKARNFDREAMAEELAEMGYYVPEGEENIFSIGEDKKASANERYVAVQYDNNGTANEVGRYSSRAEAVNALADYYESQITPTKQAAATAVTTQENPAQAAETPVAIQAEPATAETAQATTGAIADVTPFEEAGFKRWQKNDMDRLYISVSKLGMSDAVRNVKGRVSVWLDVLTGEVQATKNTPTSVIEAAQELVNSVREGHTQTVETQTEKPAEILDEPAPAAQTTEIQAEEPVTPQSVEPQAAPAVQNTQAATSMLDNIRQAGALNTPYETVVNSAKDMVEAGAITAEQVSDAYAQGLAEYNKNNPSVSDKNDSVNAKAPIKKDNATKFAVAIAKNWGSNVDTETVASSLRRTSEITDEMRAGDLSTDDLESLAYEYDALVKSTARLIADNVVEYEQTGWDDMALKKKIRETPIKLSESQANYVKRVYGSMREYSRELQGRATVSQKSGSPLSVFWRDLPFDPDNSFDGEDLPEIFLNSVKDLYGNKKQIRFTEEERNGFADEIAADINRYLSDPEGAIASLLARPKPNKARAKTKAAADTKPAKEETKPAKKAETKQEEKTPAANNENKEPAATNPQNDLANTIAERLVKPGTEFNSSLLFELANKAFGGTQAEGVYTVKDAYDALELAVNKVLLEKAKNYNGDAKTAVSAVKALQMMLDKLPTQTKRSEEQEIFQQFSTPPNIAYLAAWAANINSADVVLEPSAGIGGLAIFPKAWGAEVVVNELSDRRFEFIKNLPFDGFYNENAEQINNILPDLVKPSVVIMNPPFSSTAGRTATNKTSNAIRHVEQALLRLEDGGRLVAILGRGMANDTASFRGWWNELRKEYDIRANLSIDGSNYRKYGTSFDVQLVVIDKTGPQKGTTLTGTYKDLTEIPKVLEGIRDDRIAVEGSLSGSSASSNGGVLPDAGVYTGNNISRPGRVVGIEQRGAQLRPEETVPSPADGTGRPGTDTEGVRTTANSVQRSGDGRGIRGSSSELSGGVRRGAANDGVRTDGSVRGVTRKKTKFDNGIYADYVPEALTVKNAKPHPARLVESAAMASVPSPVKTYVPNIPQTLIDSGALSAAQLENIINAGQAHEQTLPTGERRGYFIGDGTGVGKGREIAGIILDNFRRGRTKAVWVSKGFNLLSDAKRDWTGLKQNEDDVISLKNIKLQNTITSNDGILFTSYDTLRSEIKGQSRLQQIVNWLGEDFDGVIVFDEAHIMNNLLGKKGKRGKTEGAKVAAAGVALQRALPNARVVYASATGATDVDGLAFAERLGLWGKGTAFADVNDFIAKISASGVSAMELVSRDMKAMGIYLARSISYDGVEYSTLQHTLTPVQTKIYDTTSKAWQVVLQNTEKALEITGTNRAKGLAKSVAISQFYSSMQNFYNQVLTSMSMPSVIENIREELAAGHSCVLQIVNTSEAEQERQLKKIKEDDGDLDDLDITPRGALLGYLEKSFPVQVHEEYTDDNGNTYTRPVYDKAGNPVLDKQAVAMRDALIEQINEMSIPDGPLDMLFDAFGTENVAEVTGRKRRVVPKKDKNGNTKRVEEKRSDKSNEADVNAFQDGKKRILVFSGAGNTGKSYHSDLNAKNQQQRIHYLLQPGWNASEATQGFGRTHRSNQANAPKFVLVTTNASGQKRFVSTIARRLGQLGAITKGQREAGSGIFNEKKDNLETAIARDSLRIFYERLGQSSTISGINGREVINKLGLKKYFFDEYNNFKVKDEGIAHDMSRFLNRILALELDEQNEVFDSFYALYERLYDEAEQNGTLDKGLENVRADKIDIIDDKVVRTDEATGATTNYVQAKTYTKTKVLSDFNALPDLRQGYQGIYRTKEGNTVAVYRVGDKTQPDGSVKKMYRLQTPQEGKYGTWNEDSLAKNAEKLSMKEAETAWADAVAKTPEFQERTIHMLTGTLLPIWDSLPTEGNVKAMRITADDGSQYLGRVISDAQIDTALNKLGAGKHTRETFTADDITRRVMSGETVTLTHDRQKLKRARVSGEYRIEVTGKNLWALNRYPGVIVETIAYTKRYFIPTGKIGDAIIKALIDNNPVSRISVDDDADLLDTSKALGPTEWWDSERVGDSKEAMRISDIINKMRHDFGIPIGKGKTNVRGQYNVKPHTIATKIANDLPATAHELGHFLDHEYDIVSSLSSELKDELINNLDPRVQEAYSKDKLANEGLAEFVRRYLQNSYTAEIDFPQFTEYFRNALPANVLKMVDAFADEINAYYASGAKTAQSAIRHATDTPIDYRTTKEKLSAAASKEYQTWVDDLHRLKVFDEQAGSNVYLFARNSKYADNIAYQVVSGDLTNQNGDVVSDGLAKILAPINKKNAAEWDDFGEYLVVKHGPSWLTDSKKPKRVFADDRMNTPEFMMRRVQELEDQYPYFRDVAESLYEFQRTFLEVWGVNTGLVSKEAAAEWAERYPCYVPLNRYLYDKQGGNGVKRGLANQNSTIKRAKGSGADIIHPVDNIITNVVKMVSAGTKNSVMVELHKAYNDTDGLGNLIERVKPDMKVTKYDARGLKENLVEALTGSDIDQDNTEQAIKTVLHNIDDYLLQFTPEHRAHGNTITILVDGKPVSYKVNDPQLLESLTSMSAGTVPKVVKWYGSISRFMTSSITGLNVVWSIGSNSVRDFASLLTYSKDKNVLHIAKGLIDAYKNSFAKPEKQDPLYKQYLALGGGSESVFAGNKDMTKTIYDKITGNKKRWLNPLNQLEFISNVVERGPRYAAFKMAIDMGMTPQEAIYESHNITVDFRRGGNISRQLNNFIPFFNASVQGIDRLTSWITCQDVPKEQRAKAAASRAGWYIAAYALLGAVQFLINNGDDEDEKYYEQLSNYTKNNFWCIPIHDSEGHTGEFITIPKPRELAFPATLTSNLLELVVNGNKEAFDELGEYAAGSFLPNLADDAVKDIVGFIQGDTTLKDAFGDILGNFGVLGVMAYAMANRDFLGKPIESSSFENSAEREKYTGRTSKLAYALGQVLNQSPIMIDYIGQQMLGGFWKTQKALFPMSSENVDYTLGLSNTYRRDSQYSTDLVNDMYDIRDNALKAHNSDSKDSAAAVAYKEASNMTSFYSRYNSLEGSDDKDTRQIVLDMIDEFVWTEKYGERSEVQSMIDEVCAEMDSTDYMCKVVQNYIKDGDGTKHTLTAAQYVEYQGLYNSAYWEYVEPIVRSDSSIQEKGIAIMQAQSKAIKEAQSIILNRMGLSSKDSETLAAEKAAGISSDESLAFQSAIEAIEGKVGKSDVYDILDSMDLTDDERAYLYSTRGYSEGSNIYYTSGDLNEWISSERKEGREDGSIARTITSTYKELYIEYARKNNKSGMRKIEDKLKKLKLYKKDGTAYYTAETFSDWLSD